ncbi:MAG: PTS sugar transporter subunit IIC, partial [Syntrophaceae bacterium]|nr:PTS sugar transporter subunit IIC [Syntrophaceae bacterium]
MLDLLSLDPSLLPRVCIAAATGALLCLDKIAVQFMLSRPLVASSIIGTIVGTPLVGLTVGAMIEIFWVNKSPLGTYMPPNDTLVSILITITLAILADPLSATSRELFALSVLVYLPLGIFFQKLESLPAWFNNHLSDKLMREVESSGDGMYHLRMMPFL